MNSAKSTKSLNLGKGPRFLLQIIISQVCKKKKKKKKNLVAAWQCLHNTTTNTIGNSGRKTRLSLSSLPRNEARMECVVCGTESEDVVRECVCVCGGGGGGVAVKVL